MKIETGQGTIPLITLLGIRSTGDGFNISLDPKILVLASPSLKFKSFIV